MPVTLDPSDPDFPHGTTNGYSRGCRHGCPTTPTCSIMEKRSKYARSQRRAEVGPLRGIDARPLLDHVQHLLDQAPGLTIAALFESVGMNDSSHASAVATETTSRTCYDKIIAITADDARAARQFVPVTETRAVAGQLQGQGFPISWQARRVGHISVKQMWNGPAENRMVTRYLHDSLVDLRDELDGREASPELDGIPKRGITYAKMLATRAGYRQAEEPAPDTSKFVPATETRELIGRMRAQGFTIEWQAKEAGRVAVKPIYYQTVSNPGRTVTRDVHEAVKALYNRLDGRIATPADGLTQQAIRYAMTHANRDGFYPSAAYNEDGTLSPRAISNHPWAQADDRCAALIELAHLLATTGNRAEAIRAAGDRPGDEQRATRIVRRLGITFAREETDETTGETRRFVYEPHEARQVNRDIFDHIETTWEAYDSGTIGPVYAALTIGVAKLGNRGAGSLPQDHPEVLEWRAEQAAEDELDQAPQAA